MHIGEILENLVGIPSTTGSEDALAYWIEGWLQERGFVCRRIPVTGERFDLVATTPKGPARWMLYGHLDTVPPSWEWQRDPFFLGVSGERLTGLGAWDMKAGLAAMLWVAENWAEHHPPLSLAFAVDEEGESHGVEALVASGALDGIDAVLVPEAAPGADRDHLAMTLGRPGRILLDVELRARGGHAADPGSTSALEAGARVVTALGELPVAEHPTMGKGRAVARSFSSSSFGALSLPELASLQIDRLLVPPETTGQATEAARAYLEQAVEGLADLSLSPHPRPGPYLQPYEIPPDDPLVGFVLERLAQVGWSPNQRVDPSPADENRLVMAGVPVVTLSPLGGNAHQAGEWVDARSLELLGKWLRQIALAEPPPRPRRAPGG